MLMQMFVMMHGRTDQGQPWAISLYPGVDKSSEEKTMLMLMFAVMHGRTDQGQPWAISLSPGAGKSSE